jgi:hypothetical protein
MCRNERTGVDFRLSVMTRSRIRYPFSAPFALQKSCRPGDVEEAFAPIRRLRHGQTPMPAPLLPTRLAVGVAIVEGRSVGLADVEPDARLTGEVEYLSDENGPRSACVEVVSELSRRQGVYDGRLHVGGLAGGWPASCTRDCQAASGFAAVLARKGESFTQPAGAGQPTAGPVSGACHPGSR